MNDSSHPAGDPASAPGANASNAAGEFESYWRLRTEGATSRLQALKEIVSHNPTTGTFAEALLRDLIAEFLPQRYAAATGFIIDGQIRSKQIDLLVYDQREDLPVFRDGGFVVLTPGTARLAVEVKSQLVHAGSSAGETKTFGALGGAFDNIASVKAVDPKVRGFVFAFDGNAVGTFLQHAAAWSADRGGTSEARPDRIFNMAERFSVVPRPGTAARDGSLRPETRHDAWTHLEPHLVVRAFLTSVLQSLDVANLRSFLPADPIGERIGSF